MTPAARPDWHAQPRETVLERLRARAEGLTSEEAHERLAGYGPNELPAARSPSLFTLALDELTSPLMYALIAAGVLALALGELEDGLVVLAVVVLNTAIGTVQEYRTAPAVSAGPVASLGSMRAHSDPKRLWVATPCDRATHGVCRRRRTLPRNCGSGPKAKRPSTPPLACAKDEEGKREAAASKTCAARRGCRSKVSAARREGDGGGCGAVAALGVGRVVAVWGPV